MPYSVFLHIPATSLPSDPLLLPFQWHMHSFPGGFNPFTVFKLHVIIRQLRSAGAIHFSPRQPPSSITLLISARFDYVIMWLLMSLLMGVTCESVRCWHVLIHPACTHNEFYLSTSTIGSCHCYVFCLFQRHPCFHLLIALDNVDLSFSRQIIGSATLFHLYWFFL